MPLLKTFGFIRTDSTPAETLALQPLLEFAETVDLTGGEIDACISGCSNHVFHVKQK